MRSLLFILLPLVTIFSCQNKVAETYYLGKVALDVTGSSEAKEAFEKGLLLLHSFEYEDALTAFEEAQQLDPQMGMAYWGEAMTYNHPLWSQQDYEKGVQALEDMKAADATEKLQPLEDDFIESAEILYAPEKPKTQRDQDYADFMGELHKKYPNNHEVAAFYALSLLGSVSDGRDETRYGQGAEIAKQILAQNPNHPGALHYLIHSYDDPDHAPLALEAAFSYAEVAPDASHALHMPSHIYVAMGMWDEVVSSNERSYQASLNRMERKGLGNDARGYHAFHWLEYGYLQQERFADARKLVLDMEQYMTETPSERARAHMVFLKGTYLSETNEWNDPIADIEVDLTDLNLAVQSQFHCLEGMKAFHNGDADRIVEMADQIKNNYQRAEIVASDEGLQVCSGVSRETPSESNIKEAQAMEAQLRAMYHWLDRDTDKTEEWLKKSVEIENELSYSFGPPFIQKPTLELYAEWLLSQNRIEEAREAFKGVLERAPNRTRVLKALKDINGNEVI